MTTSIGFHAFFRDCAYAGRSLARSPGFALFTAAMIGLGVGATTTVFSVLKPLTLAALPFEEPGRLVWISNESASGGTSLSHVTSRSSNLRDFRERATSFEGLTGYNAFSEQTAYTLTGTGEPARLVGFEVAHDFLAVMGVRPSHGRGFDVEEGTFGGPPAVILSFGFWQTRFAGDPSIVGRAITLNEVPRTVVGVLPATFDFSSIFTPGVRVHFLTPYPVSDETDNHGNEMIILGRMRPSVTPEAAQAELDAVLNGLREEQPDRWGLGARLSPLQAHLAGPFRTAFLLLAAAAGTLLLIVCVNVSNLLLARAPGRAHEVAVRMALGASRRRVARQFILESSGIALAGAGVGVFIAWVATRLVAGTAAIRIPLLDRVHMDASALLFGTALAVVTGLLVSVVPAFQVTDGGEASVLRASGRGASASGRSRRMRETLVVAEVALACVLLMLGGLLVRSFKAVLDVDLGFDPAEAVVWQINPTPDFESLPEMSGFYGAIADRVTQVPGVEAVGLIDALPLGRNRNWSLRVVGVPEEEDNGFGFFPHIVDAGYLRSMHTPLVAGRDFTRDDLEETQKVVLMNESGARRVFGEVDAVGRQIRTGGIREVVGIVQDVRHVSPEMDAGTQVYFPITQRWSHQTMDMVVRSHLPTEQVAAAVATALREVDPAMPVSEFWTLDFTVDRAMSARRFTLGILTAYGLAALLLAGLGIYGVLAQSVAERNHEIGIRMALGASASKVVRSVLGRTLLLAVVGVFIGAILSGWSTRMVGSLLFGVSATDPATFLGMAAVLLLVATAAGALPAIRAARIRGISALRAE
jgi:putative ABC transport system permease protein